MPRPVKGERCRREKWRTDVMQSEDEQALYRFFSDSNQLLYIGISIHPFTRMGQHKHDKSWWGEVAKVTIERFPNRIAVEEAEREAIRAEQPRYNVVHAGRRVSKPRAYCWFSYVEPGRGAMRLPNLMPSGANRTLIRCGCGRANLPTEFMETDSFLIYEAKCSQCKESTFMEVAPTTDRLVMVKGKRGAA